MGKRLENFTVIRIIKFVRNYALLCRYLRLKRIKSGMLAEYKNKMIKKAYFEDIRTIYLIPEIVKE